MSITLYLCMFGEDADLLILVTCGDCLLRTLSITLFQLWEGQNQDTA